MRLLWLSLLPMVLSSPAVHAALLGNTVPATRYDITVKKVELCSDVNCSFSYFVGASTRTFDIAGASAGADVGSYVDISGIPLFQTWSHVRVTLASQIVVTAAGNDDQGQACQSDQTDASASHTTPGVGIAAAGAGTPQNVFIPDVGALGGNPTAGDYTGFNMSKVSGGDATIVFPLAQPYTCKGVMPNITIKFDTQTAASFVDTNGAGAGQSCRLYPRPPVVTITVTDP
ncbi:MAG: hypothetical protein AB7N54_13200 [Alphaproteobacteria bacterium]